MIGRYSHLSYRPMRKPVMVAQNDDWMEMTYGGSRTSPYQEQPENVPRETLMERFRREAADFKREKIDRMIEGE